MNRPTLGPGGLDPFAVDNVQTGFGKVMKAWEAAPARRAGLPWAKTLDGELGGFSAGLGDLARVKAGRKAEVLPVATRLSERRERIDALVRDHKTELPRDLAEAWSTTAFWLSTLRE